jgi:hypothetical protein
MFLWITSPAPPTYCGGGSRVFDSSAFFDVSPPDPNTLQRTFLPHTCSPLGGLNRFLLVRDAKVGPHGLPVIIAKRGRMLDVEPAPLGPSGKPMILNEAGKAVEIESLRVRQGKAIFMDKTGTAIPRARPMMRTRFNRTGTVQQFAIDRRVIFVDLFGNVIETEEGQAVTGAVLMSQTNSLTYYVSIVNDVFAYFLTGVRGGQITPTANQFPTTPADLAQITAFASSHNVTFPDPMALAVELKSSWVEASTLPNPDAYVTTMATVPTYAQSATQWTPNGQKRVKLALVGLHVVGRTGTNASPNGPGHPEMIWATFEHIGNTPLDTYTYNQAPNSTAKTVARDTSGKWLFSNTSATEPFNCMLMFEQGGNIVPAPTQPPCPPGGFTPSNTVRRKAWGAATGVSPNPIDGSDAVSNTEVISINNSFRGMMPAGDVRNNYYFAGSTWTIFGAAPNPFNQVGTSMLGGSTMETYVQGPDNTGAGGHFNCFSCHVSSPNMFGRATTDVSHIFGALSPLTFPTLSVQVTVLQRTAQLHTIRVAASNSVTGAPVAGATVTVSDTDSGDVIATGTTGANGTVTLKYPRCLITELELPRRPPRPIPVACDGSAHANGLGDASFTAP